MITVYDAVGGKLKPRDRNRAIFRPASGSTCINPAEDEDKSIEQALGIEVPTRSEMREIEASNRFYTENGAYYMTGIILHNSSQDVPMTSVITFILSGTHLVTVRYADPRAFPVYVARAAKGDTDCVTGAGIMIGLIEMLIEREADLIERVQDEVERMAPVRCSARRARTALAQPSPRRPPENRRQGRRRDGESPGKRHVRCTGSCSTSPTPCASGKTTSA